MTLAPAGMLDGSATERLSGWSRRWAYAAALSLSAILWMFAWYWETAEAIVSIWERSETFAHGYLILPISAWLIWRRREALAALAPRPCFAVLPLLVVVGFGWLLAKLAAVGVIQQYGLVLMIPLLTWTILGTRVALAMAFPLLYLLFAVPFGEFLVPPLMDHTADIVVSALRLTGIPVYREGLFFTIPSGNWSVIEACSGLRYLIASVTLGVLYAYLTYRSLARRLIFIVFAAIVPLVANWLRAYMIVMIGHLSGMKYAVGVDHLLYGWVLFGAVMLGMFWVGSYWREDLAAAPPALAEAAVPPADAGSAGSLARLSVATVAAAAILAIWPAAAQYLAGGGPNRTPDLKAPPAAEGWQAVPGAMSSWTPRFMDPRAQINQVYVKNDLPVGVYIGYFRNQHRSAALISSRNVLVFDMNADWGVVGESRRELNIDGGPRAAIEARLRGAKMNLIVWRWYWVDGEYTVNPVRAKLLQARSTLLGRGDDGAVVVVYAPQGDRAGAELMREFVGSMLPGITRKLEHARGAIPGA